MKNKIFRLGILNILLCWSCVNDLGNYDYKNVTSVAPIEVLGLPDDTTFKVLETIMLTPELKGMDDEKNFEFTWYTYPPGATGIPIRDTLGRERNLTFKMMYAAGENRVMVYEVKDKRTGIAVNKRISFSGVSDYGQGWVILKDENNQTDIDFVFPDGTQDENILYKNTQIKLKGRALKVVNQTYGYKHQFEKEDGFLEIRENLRAWHLLSSSDMVTLNPDNLTVYKTFEDEFYRAPETCAPQDFYNNGGDLYLLNAGAVHTLSNSSANIGKLGLPRFGDARVFPKLVVAGQYLFGFSNETKSFVVSMIYDSDLSHMAEANTDNPVQISPNHMNAEMLALLQRTDDWSGVKAWALMKSITENEEYYLADLFFMEKEYPFVDFDVISPDRALVHADVYAANDLYSIWFAKGNVLSYYNKGISDEESEEVTDIYPFPAGETITWMQQSEGKYLLVLTNTTDKWKFYRFELDSDGLSPNIKPGTQPLVYSGNGTARYALKIGDWDEDEDEE